METQETTNTEQESAALPYEETPKETKPPERQAAPILRPRVAPLERKIGLGWLLAGPIVLGAVLGLPWGWSAVLYEAVVLPGVVFGTTLLMLPALYIGATIAGVAPSLQVVLRSFGRALGSTGSLLLGLAPLCGFLLLSNPADTLWAWLLGAGTLTVSLWVGLRTLQEEMFAKQERSYLWWPLFWGWALIALLIGERLFTKSFYYIGGSI